MSQEGNILLKSGTVLIHAKDDHVTPVVTDILISGSKIAKIEPSIVDPSAEVIDCSDKIISPGFVDTHHHVWQTQFKGVHANQTLPEFLAHGTSGNFVGKHATADDVFWGQLAGCMEMINAGTTTVVDYAHINPSLEYNYKAIAATAASGVRSIFCHAAMTTISDWETFSTNFDVLRDHANTLAQLVETGPFGDGRITIGFAFDGWSRTPKEYLDMLMYELNRLSIPLITYHYWWRDGEGARPTAIEEMCKSQILDHRWLIAHANNMPPTDAELIRKTEAHISSTPSTELHFSMGFPVIAFRNDLKVKHISSLGVDCHSVTSAFMPGEARIGLQSSRAARGEVWLQKGKVVREVGYSVEEAFNLMTVLGARGAKMEPQIGSIAVGKLADLVMFDKTSPSMVCASEQDPVAAILLHSSPADVDTVIVGGVVRKRAGRLESVALDKHGVDAAGRSQLSWQDVAKAVGASRMAMQERLSKIDMQEQMKRAHTLLYGSGEDLVSVE
ncbi:hypothetical protein QQS21_003576 [Conoideocrella luteorostrata]|uniref:Amidohydrolase-related domain-containing protein n=1 Tax=Conoideocrella luteorostrata TaxID=1105319 RepID=A0AAJ0CW51_9HYPO|nr:hypothetical protein QQS21_003576 [Conoideocrella luteorostrata]